MSVDAFGRVIVGSGHFIERAVVMAERVAQIGNHIVVGNGINQIERGMQVINGVGQQFSNGYATANAAAERARDEAAMNALRHDEHRFSVAAAIADDRQTDIDRSFERAQRDRDFNERQWERTKEVGKDLALSLGWGLAGDLGQATEKAVEATAKCGEIFWEDTKHNWDKICELFEK